MITTGGYDRESGLKVAEETGQLIGYGRAFLSNVSLLCDVLCTRWAADTGDARI